LQQPAVLPEKPARNTVIDLPHELGRPSTSSRLASAYNKDAQALFGTKQELDDLLSLDSELENHLAAARWDKMLHGRRVPG
jgi:hypothetical protein